MMSCHTSLLMSSNVKMIAYAELESLVKSMRHELTSRYYFGKIVVLNEIYRGYWKFPNTFNNK